jgi:hypothetical protein
MVHGNGGQTLTLLVEATMSYYAPWSYFRLRGHVARMQDHGS